MSVTPEVQCLLDAVAPLLNTENVQHFYSAWEMDHNVNGMELHARLLLAYEALVATVGVSHDGDTAPRSAPPSP